MADPRRGSPGGRARKGRVISVVLAVATGAAVMIGGLWLGRDRSRADAARRRYGASAENTNG